MSTKNANSGAPKGTSWAKAMLNSEKIKPVSLATAELCLSEGISQAVSQTVSQAVEISIKYFLKAFRISLKAFLGLVLPNHHDVRNLWLVYR